MSNQKDPRDQSQFPPSPPASRRATLKEETGRNAGFYEKSNAFESPFGKDAPEDARFPTEFTEHPHFKPGDYHKKSAYRQNSTGVQGNVINAEAGPAANYRSQYYVETVVEGEAILCQGDMDTGAFMQMYKERANQERIRTQNT